MKVFNWIVANWDSIVVVATVLAGLLALVKKGEERVLKRVLYSLVTQAEKQLGGSTGALKYAQVVDWIYQRLPKVLQLLFTEKDINKLIETALDEAKQRWAETPETLQSGQDTAA